MSTIDLGNYGGFIIGPLLFGSILHASNREAGFIVCGVISIVGTFIGLLRV